MCKSLEALGTAVLTLGAFLRNVKSGSVLNKCGKLKPVLDLTVPSEEAPSSRTPVNSSTFSHLFSV